MLIALITYLFISVFVRLLKQIQDLATYVQDLKGYHTKVLIVYTVIYSSVKHPNVKSETMSFEHRYTEIFDTMNELSI